MRKLAVSQITTAPLTIAEDIELCQTLGAGLEIAEKKLSTDPVEIRDQLAFIKESGVRVTSIQPRTLSIFPTESTSEPAAPEARLANLVASVDLFSDYWTGLPLVTNTGANASGNEAAVWDGCLVHYPILAAHAQSRGMLIALEALGPSLMNRNSVLFTFSQAQEMTAAIKHPALGLCLDLYNSWQDSALMTSISAEQLFLVQLADWRRPKSLHDRRTLGEGSIPLAALLKCLSDCGYAGDHVLEIFSESVPDSLWKDRDTIRDAVLQSSKAFDDIKGSWRYP